MKPSAKPQHAPADFFGTKKPLGVIPEDGQTELSDQQADNFMTMSKIPTRSRAGTKKYDLDNFDF